MSDVDRPAGRLRQLHQGPLLVLPNAWDAASARSFEKAGFAAIATTSGGVAGSLGYRDFQDAPGDVMLDAAARIACRVDIPVSADLEGGYGWAADDLAARIVDGGVAGANIEDTDHDGEPGTLVDIGRQAERLAALKDAVLARGGDLFLNARIDVFARAASTDPASLVDDALQRAEAYIEAGAESVYPILLDDEAALASIVEALDVPVNAMLRPGSLPLQVMRSIGVRRVTFGSSLFQQTMTTVDALAASIHETPLGA